MPELRPEAADAVWLERAAEKGLPFVGGVEAEDDAEEDGEEGVAEVEHEVSDPDPVDGEEEADQDLAEGNRCVVVKEG